MTVFDAVLLLSVAGFLSGVVNAVAGGGTFITFGAHDAGRHAADRPPTPPRRSPSFPATSPRRSPIGTTSGISGAARWLLCLISAVGALAGALILLALDNPSFRVMVPWLLLAATALFAAGPG